MPTQTDEPRLVTILLVILGAFVLFPMVVMGVGMIGFGPMMGGMWGDGTVSGWMVVAGLVMQLLFLAALVGGGYLLYRTLTGDGEESDRALEELRLAYARGELSDEEYEQRRENLERDS